MSVIVDRRNLDFILFELLEIERLLGHPRYAAYDRPALQAILDVAQGIAEESFLPIAAEVDANEPRFADGKVVMPDGTAQALRAFAEAGFFALPFNEDIGGLQAPWVVHTAVGGLFTCANTSVTNYAFLTIAAANLLNTFGSSELKRQFLPAMLAGRWFATMCLSEPQAGSSLADITTAAIPRDDGAYRIRGNKMWISGGEQDISENIVHMLLAKIPGGPSGTKGISLFLVPKRLCLPDGSAGRHNNIALAGLNHKMGQRGTTNCLLNFGEDGECLGYLIGEPHRGIEYMFHMMNEARIGVGHAAVMSALGGYLYSAEYARTRAQGRPIGQKDKAQVPIIEHADIRRMLMAQKAAVEGAQALCLYCAMLIDALVTEEDLEEAKAHAALLGLLTPVVKSWPAEHCLEANKWAIQVLGGYGYTRDYPVERLYRDNRLNHIHEGTFGIQGIDLLGRKIVGDRGEALNRLDHLMRRTVAEALREECLREEAERLVEGLEALSSATQVLLSCGDPDRRLANATLYLDGFGHVVIGWMWLKQAIVASRKLALGEVSQQDSNFYDGKIMACRYFARYELPLARAQLALCGSLDTTCLDAPISIFGG
ncbi:acyl-CoA dehydrogenase [Bradyrhizobium sp.]|jgi:butyryl-CoA dehydrogenase|uniref:acyl-CoA dehydrogenase n=1 Tax=Bradyrhizobium sp. TaxID=376 RepID=UPI002DDCCC97|nr:acyl-CoA dehydrogenase [Bradyrhizobium sp.]HEV2160466.1 acyl-CoA dehydrogenase [Bradyrhizobium sp.]